MHSLLKMIIFFVIYIIITFCKLNFAGVKFYTNFYYNNLNQTLMQRPYTGKTRKELKDNIIANQAEILPEDLPSEWSYTSAEFINKLIQRNPEDRLGFNSINEIKNHPFFNDFPWKSLIEGKMVAEFLPEVK